MPRLEPPAMPRSFGNSCGFSKARLLSDTARCRCCVDPPPPVRAFACATRLRFLPPARESSVAGLRTAAEVINRARDGLAACYSATSRSAGWRERPASPKVCFSVWCRVLYSAYGSPARPFRKLDPSPKQGHPFN